MKALLFATAIVTLSAPAFAQNTATTNNTATVGAQVNSIYGNHNAAVNNADIDQNSAAVALGHPQTGYPASPAPTGGYPASPPAPGGYPTSPVAGEPYPESPAPTGGYPASPAPTHPHPDEPHAKPDYPHHERPLQVCEGRHCPPDDCTGRPNCGQPHQRPNEGKPMRERDYPQREYPATGHEYSEDS